MGRKHTAVRQTAEIAQLKLALEKATEKLKNANRRLKELDKLKDEFISMAAHELRTPMSAVKGYISMILEGDAGDISKKAREFLGDANAVTDRLVRLVNNMLNVSRIEAGRLVYQMEEVELAKVAQEIFYSFRFEADRKGINLFIDIPDGTKDEVLADPERIREVVGNFVSNAVKFTEEGSVAINLSNSRPDYVRLEVSDTGPGITEEEQKRLFKKFYRVQSTAGKTIGTGLGLYITKLYVEKFKGKIGLESEFGKGSTFWVELPLMKEKQLGD
jgi:signal transduction histidine kinase